MNRSTRAISLHRIGTLAAAAATAAMLSGCLVVAPQAPAKPTPPKPVKVVPNVASKQCYMQLGSDEKSFLLSGIRGYCAPGGYVRFRMGEVNNFLVDQICDPKRNVHRTKGDGYESVECVVTGVIADPERTFFGAPVVIERPTK